MQEGNTTYENLWRELGAKELQGVIQSSVDNVALRQEIYE